MTSVTFTSRIAGLAMALATTACATAGNGNFMLVHINGKKSIEGKFVDGKPSGAWTWWHATGNKAQVGQYVKGAGAQTGYFDTTAETVQYESYTKDNLFEGNYTEYHSNGKVKLEGPYVADERHGTWQQFTTTGAKEVVACYWEGQSIHPDACVAEDGI